MDPIGGGESREAGPDDHDLRLGREGPRKRRSRKGPQGHNRAQAAAQQIAAGHHAVPIDASLHLLFGTPGGTRTPNLLVRSQALYPIELRAPGGGGAIRTLEGAYTPNGISSPAP